MDADSLSRNMSATASSTLPSSTTFISPQERNEQRLTDLFDTEETEIVRQLLSILDEGELIRAVTGVGTKTAFTLLKRAIVRAEKPATSLVLEPYYRKDLGPVTWLLERLEVGLTGVIVTVRIWTTWPDEAHPTQETMRDGPLRWSAAWSHPLTDDVGTQMRFMSGEGGGGMPIKVSSTEWSGTRLTGTFTSWWMPGVAPDARNISLNVGGDIAVHTWRGGAGGSFTSVSVQLEPTSITLELPKQWHTQHLR